MKICQCPDSRCGKSIYYGRDGKYLSARGNARGWSLSSCEARRGNLVAQPEKENLILNKEEPTMPNYNFLNLLSRPK